MADIWGEDMQQIAQGQESHPGQLLQASLNAASAVPLSHVAPQTGMHFIKIFI